MKPIYLEFQGINSFEDKAQIDFAKLLSGGVFGIFGDTGSGKSTILDSIHYALYGVIDRSPKAFTECINHRSDGVSVTFDFEICTDGVRHTYRVMRKRGRKNNTTKAWLYQLTSDGKALSIAEGASEVDKKIQSIIGLTFADFKMCIALPQGDFAALVKAATKDRVDLIARLFDLEKYGEKLFKAVNAKYALAESEVKQIVAKMEENEGNDEEAFTHAENEVKELRVQVKSAENLLTALDEQWQTQTSIQKEKQKFDELVKHIRALQTRLQEMQEKRTLLEGYPNAAAVQEKVDERRKAEENKRAAQDKAEAADKALLLATETIEKAKAYLAENDFDNQIVTLKLQLQKIRDSAQERAHAQQVKKAFDECVAEFRKLNNRCPAEDFDAQSKEIEEQLAALGEDTNLLDYLKRNCKGVLLADTYGEIRQDLSYLAQKYPIVAEDAQALRAKYTTDEQDGQEMDFVHIQLAFREIEATRKRLQKQKEALDERRQNYAFNEREKALVKKRGEELRGDLIRAQEKVAGVQELGTEAETLKKIDDLQRAQEKGKRAQESAQASYNERQAEGKAQRQLATEYAAKERSLVEAVQTLLQTHGFASEEEALALIRRVGDFPRLQRECKVFFEDYELCVRQYESADKTAFEGFDENALISLSEKRREAKCAKEELTRTLNFKEAHVERLKALREKYKEQEKILKEKRANLQVCEELRSLLSGNKFLNFIATEYLQEICLTASKTLLSLTGGRYFLQYGKDFMIGDNREGGDLRTVRTLSGGETFLVSLSLALSLSASICQKSRRPIEFFFLDEGFGTLDEKLVETVMDVLGKLSKTFSVGLISHVEELKRRIENKILVTGATDTKGSTLRVETF